MLWRMRNFIFRITHLSFWFQNYQTCWDWDARLFTILMQKDVEIKASGCYASVNGIVLWVGNYPYAFGSMAKDPNEFLPSPLTRALLKKRLSQI